MTKEEIKDFIEIMATVGEKWTPEQVEAKFGNLTLKEAVDERIARPRKALSAFFDSARRNSN